MTIETFETISARRNWWFRLHETTQKWSLILVNGHGYYNLKSLFNVIWGPTVQE